LRLAARVLAALAGVILLIVVAGFFLLRHAVNDGSVPVVPSTAALFAPGAPRTVLAVWAHPDDEITAAGTLARMAAEGATVTLLYFTHGEAAHHTGFTADQLYRMRPTEAKAAGDALHARVIVLDYGDSKLPQADGARAKGEIASLIATLRPSTVISFDERVGYYGHPDHAEVGRWTAEVVRAGMATPGYPVMRLYQATLPAPVIALARRHIAAFRDHYPADPAKGLPAPTVAVPIASEAYAKRAVLDAHKSQVKVIDDVQPFGRKLPPWLYYRLLDREYFTLAAKTG
jgi:LmbE family N-acetylglucosaminyl deacetylase